ncbi:putative pectinesterase [Helianthus annuus]|nr:putative pectinesterase [Helianthus annuus]
MSLTLCMMASTAYALVKSLCDNTYYPVLCYSTITSHSEVTKKVKSQKDVIELAVNITKTTVEKNYFQIKIKMSTQKSLMPREIGVLHDCLEMVAETLEELTEVEKDMEECHSKKSLQ